MMHLIRTTIALPLVFASSVVGATGEPVNVNEADAEALQRLVGVGPATAEAIIEDRADNGPYATVEALTRVNGIGEATVESIREQVIFE